MDFTIHPLSPAIGTEIRGLDLSRPLDPATVAAIRAVWLDHCVVLFRDQDIGATEQRRFVGYFGTIGARSNRLAKKRRHRVEGPDYNSDVMLVSNIRQDGKPIGVLQDGELWFHHDMCYAEEPNRASFLYAIEVPKHGGNTKFANMYRAYENLPQSLKDRIEGRMVLQAYDDVQDAKLDLSVPLDEYMHYVQPAVIRHPETGRRALYINRLMTHRIEGLPQAESDALIDAVVAYAEDPANVYEHVWRPGDMLMWDNLCSIHARTDFPREERRLMRRFTIGGTRVQAAWDMSAASAG